MAEINRLLKNFLQMQKMMKGMGKGGLGRMMRSMAGRMPPGCARRPPQVGASSGRSVHKYFFSFGICL